MTRELFLVTFLLAALLCAGLIAVTHPPKGDSRPYCECVTEDGRWVPYRATGVSGPTSAAGGASWGRASFA